MVCVHVKLQWSIPFSLLKHEHRNCSTHTAQVLPPPLHEHRAVELVAFELLSGDSSARDEAHLLLASFHGNNIAERCKDMGESSGLVALLREVSLRIEHLQEFMTKNHLKRLAQV
jgi:hypothetical protein